ncbi:MAG TPA: HEAT repeat domain-containing protein [Thermoanaerobaculia bacterium]|nr:HEAT repeat domain-containing protein [Thermoanaerobaculia bacterium]
MKRLLAAALLLAACTQKPAMTPEISEKIAGLHSPDARVRGAAAYGLARMGPRALPAAPDLVALLADDLQLVREPEGVQTTASSEADSALRAIGDERLDAAMLIDALKRLPWNGRDNVAEHLKYSVDPRAIPAMIDAILTPGEELLVPTPEPAAAARASIADALGVAAEIARKHGTKVITDPRLLVALKNENLSIRRSAARALYAVGDANAIEPLLAFANDRSAEREMRIATTFALGGIRDARVVPPLIALVSDSDAAVRSAAIRGLGERRDRRAVPALTTALKDSDPASRSNAVAALASTGGASTVPALLALFNEQDFGLRDGAVRALGELRDERATDPLIALLERETSDNVRHDIGTALLQITHEDRGTDAAAWRRWRTRKSWEFWK